jgi:hypothetical protein
MARLPAAKKPTPTREEKKLLAKLAADIREWKKQQQESAEYDKWQRAERRKKCRKQRGDVLERRERRAREIRALGASRSLSGPVQHELEFDEDPFYPTEEIKDEIMKLKEGHRLVSAATDSAATASACSAATASPTACSDAIAFSRVMAALLGTVFLPSQLVTWDNMWGWSTALRVSYSIVLLAATSAVLWALLALRVHRASRWTSGSLKPDAPPAGSGGEDADVQDQQNKRDQQKKRKQVAFCFVKCEKPGEPPIAMPESSTTPMRVNADWIVVREDRGRGEPVTFRGKDGKGLTKEELLDEICRAGESDVRVTCAALLGLANSNGDGKSAPVEPDGWPGLCPLVAAIGAARASGAAEENVDAVCAALRALAALSQGGAPFSPCASCCRMQGSCSSSRPSRRPAAACPASLRCCS